jgi:hypothetical protein
MKVLILYSGNWNDEIDVDGFIIMEKDFVSYMKRFLKNFNYTISVDIGFNETVDYDNGKDLLQEITFLTITNDESNIISKFFGKSNDFGDNLLLSIKRSSNDNGNEEFNFEKNNE